MVSSRPSLWGFPKVEVPPNPPWLSTETSDLGMPHDLRNWNRLKINETRPSYPQIWLNSHQVGGILWYSPIRLVSMPILDVFPGLQWSKTDGHRQRPPGLKLACFKGWDGSYATAIVCYICLPLCLCIYIYIHAVYCILYTWYMLYVYCLNILDRSNNIRAMLTIVQGLVALLAVASLNHAKGEIHFQAGPKLLALQTKRKTPLKTNNIPTVSW